MPSSRALRVPTRVVAEIGVMLAVFATLDLLAVRLPINVAGGSVSLAMVPVALYGLLRGPKLGILFGALAGALDMMVAPYFVHPAQIALDYSVAYAAVGLAGLFGPALRVALDRRRPAVIGSIAAGAVGAGAALRLGVHWLSGVIFFGSFAPANQPVWLYSLIYNTSYIWPSAVASAVVVAAVVSPVSKVIPALAPKLSGRG